MSATRRPIVLVIDGQTFSKANSRRLVTTGGRTRSIKPAKALAYEEAALWQLKKQLGYHRPFSRPVAVEMTIYYPSRRQDLDPSLILDIMQKAGVYENDRLVEEMHLWRMLDKAKPRAEISVWELE